MSILLGLVAVALAGKPDVLGARAAAAEDHGDVAAAVKYATKALAKDPSNADALYARGMALWTVATYGGMGDASAAYLQQSRRDLQQLIQVEPGSIRSTVARGLLSAHQATLPEPDYRCPADSVAKFQAADQAFALGDRATARAGYEAALEGCPGNATWWAYHGDTAFDAGDIAGALADYEHALTVDPCNWMAHRFAADAMLRQGDGAGALIHQVAAVQCNPGYEIGWTALGGVSASLRPFPPVGTQAWAAYSEAKLHGEGTALERTVSAVRGVAATNADPFWAALAAADASGQLEPAVFVMLLDDELIAEYPAWLADHPGELATWVVQRARVLSTPR
jgi:tetratricopeptide (TPR) repeat protein